MYTHLTSKEWYLLFFLQHLLYFPLEKLSLELMKRDILYIFHMYFQIAMFFKTAVNIILYYICYLVRPYRSFV